MQKEKIVLSSGRKTEKIILKGSGITVSLLSLGATVEDIVFNEGEKERHLTLGYEDTSLYETNPYYLGACVARVGNRIGGARFTLNGKTYELEKNDGNNNLHSGKNCLCFREWAVSELTDNSVTFIITSPDGDMGFPGEMQLGVTYTVTPDNALIIDYMCKCNEDTIFNPTNHSYFHLGNDTTILSEKLRVDADCFTPGGKESIPDGTICPVEGTPMDFRSCCRIGKRIDSDFDELKYTGGYDHNYVLNRNNLSEKYSSEKLNVYFAAELSSEDTGRKMEVYTSLPGLQVYTGNFLKGDVSGHTGEVIPHRGGVCLESQYFPNAINIPTFEQPLAKKNDVTRSRTVYHFS
ncbi:aldose epimerase family protein [Oribacterium sp. WCC10]|uniref:aldose epimerase family protein n=1 Tax=Oribacterium sp. WCC10 TaxID=1855343 RepID=UPI0008E39E18|nr:aldose epimerase family protein [Oribacterium sp. WCC10]SFG20385.1 aldose 1-epimerase [Oribacterium sp. WCC10]